MSYKQDAIAALEAHQGKYKGLSASVVAGCIKVIQDLPEDDGWIPVEERLPEEFVSVLVHIPEESPLPTVKEAYRVRGEWCTKHAFYQSRLVTHWMPLPKPPRED